MQVKAFAVFFSFLSLTGVLYAEDLHPTAPEAFVGKPAPLIASLPTATPFTATRIDSTIGKPIAPVVFDGPPPRGVGPGYRFDTHRFFYIYTDANAGANHYAPSGWMGDYGDLELDLSSREDPADGKTCIKVSYTSRGSQGFQWAGMYWQEPANNWGYVKGGYNLAGMRRATFWARGAKGGEQIAEFKVGGIHGRMPDTAQLSIGPIVLSKEWKQYVIDLSDADLSKVSGGFAWSASRFENPDGMTFYLDEIRFER